MQIGLCVSAAQGDAYRNTGADFLEENVQGFLLPLQPDAEFAPKLAQAKASPLPVRTASLFLPGAMKCVGPAVDLKAILRYADVAFSRAARVGMAVIVFGSGGSRQVPEGFPSAQALEQFVDLLKRLGPLAQAHGVRLAVEPLSRGDCNLINTLDDGLAAVRQCAHPRVGLLADIYHMTQNGESPDAILRAGPLLWHVHIAEKEKRTAPGVAGDDFRPFLDALRKIGYNGMMSIECFGINSPDDAVRAVKELRRQLGAAGY